VTDLAAGILNVLVFGAATDYALLLIARYRYQLHTTTDHRLALAAAVRSATGAIAASAGTVIAAMLCLLAATITANRGLGPVAALGIAGGLLASLTLLPALLAARAARGHRSSGVLAPHPPSHQRRTHHCVPGDGRQSGGDSVSTVGGTVDTARDDVGPPPPPTVGPHRAAARTRRPRPGRHPPRPAAGRHLPRHRGRRAARPTAAAVHKRRSARSASLAVGGRGVAWRDGQERSSRHLARMAFPDATVRSGWLKRRKLRTALLSVASPVSCPEIRSCGIRY